MIMTGHVTLSGLPMLVFGSISLVLYVWSGLVGVLRRLTRFGTEGKRVE